MNVSETEWMIEVCKSIAKARLPFKFKTQARCSEKFVTDELLLWMRNAGFEAVMLGCESGSQRVLDAMNKHLTIADIEATVKKCHNYGFKVYTYWMVGNKEETKQDLEQTKQLMDKLSPYIDGKRVSVLNPLPGSDIFKEAQKEGWIQNYNYSRWLQGAFTVMHGTWMKEKEILEWEGKLQDG